MNKPISPEPISNVPESESALGQQLLSRLVQPAGLMNLQHLPGHRTQASAQAFLQRSNLPEQIQARYTAVGQIKPMVIPGRSRVESLALGSMNDRDLGSPNPQDVGVAIGMPTLAPETPSFRSPVSDSSPVSGIRSSSSDSLSVQLAANPEHPQLSPVIARGANPISTGSFRVSRQRHPAAPTQSIPILGGYANDRPSDPSLSQIISPAAESPVMRQIVNPISPRVGSSPVSSVSNLSSAGTPLVVHRSLSINSLPSSQSLVASPEAGSINTRSTQVSTTQASTTQATIEASPVSLDITPAMTSGSTPAIALRVIAQRSDPAPDRPLPSFNASPASQFSPNAIQAMPLITPPLITPPLTTSPRVTLNLPSSSPSPQINTRSNPKIALNRIDSAIDSSPYPSLPFTRTISSMDNTMNNTVPNTIARFPTTQPSSPAEITPPPSSASAVTSITSPAPDIKHIAAQVSQLLQRQLTVEQERRGLKLW